MRLASPTLATFEVADVDADADVDAAADCLASSVHSNCSFSQFLTYFFFKFWPQCFATFC